MYHPQLINIVVPLFYPVPVITDATVININAILYGSSVTLFLHSKINFAFGKREYRLYVELRIYC